MFYVAKVYETLRPSIVESFDNEKLAQQYAEIMTVAGKGTYIVLMPVPRNEETK